MNLLKRMLPPKIKQKYRWHWWRIRHLLRPPTAPRNPDGRINVHLGCGAVNHPLFVNVDARPWPHVHHVCGVEQLPMFTDSSVDLVYVCHCLEHISFRTVPDVLLEWRRILKPEGWLRISVPDFDRIVSIFIECERDVDVIQKPLLGGQGYALNFHKSLYTQSHLTRLLAGGGFINAREWIPGSEELTDFDDWSRRPIPARGKDTPISLNIEAQKPPATP